MHFAEFSGATAGADVDNGNYGRRYSKNKGRSDYSIRSAGKGAGIRNVWFSDSGTFVYLYDLKKTCTLNPIYAKLIS
jgi:hypothetical protein